ncbi:MAG TPA: hypothetical protein PK987_03155 [Ferruginibacter sp.]|mgnify:CR=1 FL=1|nr:hypothetical protein [Ferruginibacter sp.]
MTVFKKHILILVITCFSSITVLAQDENVKNFKIDMVFTGGDKGEVFIDMKVKYSALYWDVYKRKSASNPAIIKNSLIKSFCKYSLTNFNIKNDEMDRSYQATFTILGMLKLDETGKWFAELDTKDPDITKISETQYVLVDEDLARSYKVILPSTAINSKLEKDAFGKAYLTYYAPVSSGSSKLLKYGGYLLAASGVFLFIKNRFSKKAVVI